MILLEDFSDLCQNQKSELEKIIGMTLLNFLKNARLVYAQFLLIPVTEKPFFIKVLPFSRYLGPNF